MIQSGDRAWDSSAQRLAAVRTPDIALRGNDSRNFVMPIDVAIRPARAAAQRFRAAGVWRDSGLMSDLRRWRDRTPQATAVMAYGAGGEARSITLHRVGQSGSSGSPARCMSSACDRDRWSLVSCRTGGRRHALQLAATRLQAVLAPITTTMRPLELQRMLHRVGARVCITVDEWEGFGHAAALRAIAPALPELRHRVVIGEATHGDVDFRSAFEQTPWERAPSGGAG